jgi:hypothetical protein
MCTKPTFFLNSISEINICSLMSPLMNLVWTPHFFLALAICFLGTPSGLPETTLGFTRPTQFATQPAASHDQPAASSQQPPAAASSHHSSHQPGPRRDATRRDATRRDATRRDATRRDAQCCMCTKPTFCELHFRNQLFSLMSPLMNLVWTPHFFLAWTIRFLGSHGGFTQPTSS